MQFKSLFASSILAAAAVSAQTYTTGLLGDAAVVNDNPVGSTYAATFVNGSVSGKITFVANGNGTGVDVTVHFVGFKDSWGPFPYHVHDQPVPASGNCNGTLAHLDPYQRGQATPCDKTRPETCEVGDLAGKHGAVPNTNGTSIDFNDQYIDKYISTKVGIGAFVGNRSVVIHKAGGGRLACANITLVTNIPTGPITGAPDGGSSASTYGISSILALGSMLAAAAFAL